MDRTAAVASSTRGEVDLVTNGDQEMIVHDVVVLVDLDCDN